MELIQVLKFSGAGASAGEGADPHQVEATAVAKECLLAAIKSDPKSGPLWVNLASAYDVAGDHRNAKKCLEQVFTYTYRSHLRCSKILERMSFFISILFHLIHMYILQVVDLECSSNGF